MSPTRNDGVSPPTNLCYQAQLRLAEPNQLHNACVWSQQSDHFCAVKKILRHSGIGDNDIEPLKRATAKSSKSSPSLSSFEIESGEANQK